MPLVQALAKAGVKYVAEGANMPSEADAIKVYHENKIMFGPAKVRFTAPAASQLMLLPVSEGGPCSLMLALPPNAHGPADGPFALP